MNLRDGACLHGGTGSPYGMASTSKGKSQILHPEMDCETQGWARGENNRGKRPGSDPQTQNSKMEAGNDHTRGLWPHMTRSGTSLNSKMKTTKQEGPKTGFTPEDLLEISNLALRQDYRVIELFILTGGMRAADASIFSHWAGQKKEGGSVSARDSSRETGQGALWFHLPVFTLDVTWVTSTFWDRVRGTAFVEAAWVVFFLLSFALVIFERGAKIPNGEMQNLSQAMKAISNTRASAIYLVV